MRKSIWRFVLASTILSLPLCAFAQRRNSTRPSTNTRQTEGQREANKFWSKYIPSCGGSRYLKKGPSIFVELKGLNIQVDYETTTQADRLNGIEAKGTSRYSASSYRSYSNSTWHQWGNGIPEDLKLSNVVRFQKIKGRWNFSGVGYFDNFTNPMSCSDLPWLRSQRQTETPTNSVQISDSHVFPIEEFTFWDSNTKTTGTRFPQSTTTFINWQITYSGTAFDYTLSNLEQYWYDKNGAQILYSDIAHFSNVGKGKLSWEKGWEDPGRWEVGEYTVKVYLKKQLIAKKSFEIVPDDSLPSRIRTDGLYYSKTYDGFWIMKLFNDGKVVEIIFRSPKNFNYASEAAFSCFIYNNCRDLDFGQGTYRIQGPNIEFVTYGAFDRLKNAAMTFSGTITSSTLKLNWGVGTNKGGTDVFTFTACPYRGCE